MDDQPIMRLTAQERGEKRSKRKASNTFGKTHGVSATSSGTVTSAGIPDDKFADLLKRN